MFQEGNLKIYEEDDFIYDIEANFLSVNKGHEFFWNN